MIPRKKAAIPILAVPVPNLEDWGGVVHRSMFGKNSSPSDLAAASDAIDAAIVAIDDAALSTGDTPTCHIQHPREERYDAVGFWRSKGAERIVHRYAGLSKPTPPIDPFRVGSRADDAIRCENDAPHSGRRNQPVRCEVLHIHSRGETTIDILTSPTKIPLAPWHEGPSERIRIFLGFARTCMDALLLNGDRSEDFMQDVLAQITHVLGDFDISHLKPRSYTSIHAASPLSRQKTRFSWDAGEFNPANYGRMPLELPQHASLMVSRDGDRTSISISPAVQNVPINQLDPMIKLRAHSRIAAKNYREITL